MAQKKDNKNILIILILAALVFLFMNKSPVTAGPSDVNIEFNTRSRSQTLAVVGGQLVPDAEGQFAVSIGNPKAVQITNVAFVSKDDARASSTFDSSTFPWTSKTIPPSSASSQTSTSWFDLEWYANNHPGTTRFTFNFKYDYKDAEGNSQLNIPIAGYADINILGEFCGDGTHLGDCNNGGGKCIYSGGNLVVVQDQTCCQQAGGTWSGSSCSLGCGAIPFGSCDTTPTPGTVKRNTYCDGTTQTMVESCSNCHCFDYYGNVEESCSASTCVFDEYDEQVTVNVVGGGAGSDVCDFCNSWVSDSCGGGSCSADKLHQTRTCTPSGGTCTPADGAGYERCVSDASCTACTCGSWANVGCGQGGCSATQMYQTRACSPSGCNTESQCVSDASCTSSPTKQVSFEQYTGDNLAGPYNLYYYAEGFVPSNNFELHSIKLRIKKLGTPDNVNVIIRDGIFNGNVIASTQLTSSMVTTTPSVINIPMNNAMLSSGQQYYIFLERPGAYSSSNLFSFSYNQGSINGQFYYSQDGGNYYQNMATRDLYFEVWGITQ